MVGKKGEPASGRTQVLAVAHSAVFLPEESDIRRQPRAPHKKRSNSFMAQFEDRALYYDCFWDETGENVFLVGPPLLNLELPVQSATFSSVPTNQPLTASHHLSRSTMLTKLCDVPKGATHIGLHFGAFQTHIEIQPSMIEPLAGARVLFTMNKDNELGWIDEWARFHVAMHKTNAIILFDNGSSKYECAELEAMLAQVPGLDIVCVVNWPYRFGARDDAALTHHYWAHFLQISSMNLTLRRFGKQAAGILNCDIDELAAPVENGTVYDLATASQFGIAALAGEWVEAFVDPEVSSFRHRDFTHVRRDPTRFLCPKKWVLDPRHEWIDDLDVFPYWHRLMNAPDRKTTDKTIGKFWHFRGISSGWKSARNVKAGGNPLLDRQDKKLMSAMGNFAKTGRGSP